MMLSQGRQLYQVCIRTQLASTSKGAYQSRLLEGLTHPDFTEEIIQVVEVHTKAYHEAVSQVSSVRESVLYLLFVW